MKILSNLSTSTTKLIGKRGVNAIVQWRAGSSQKEIKQSCIDANCAFLDGGLFIDPESGETIHKKNVKTIAGTVNSDIAYFHSKDQRPLIKTDKCFALYGTPYLSAYETEIKFPERVGMEGLQNAIDMAPRNADRARGALVGNTSTILTEDEVAQIDTKIRSELGWHILYDHAWRSNPWILKYAVASCNHMQDVKDAISMGASVCSLVMPQTMINRYKGKRLGKHRMIQCPENYTDKTNCINCGGKKGPLCEAQARENLVIMFRQHGSNSWERSKKQTIKNMVKASITEENKSKRGALIRLTLKEFNQAIKEGDRATILSIGKKAIANVTKTTAKKYRSFLEL